MCLLKFLKSEKLMCWVCFFFPKRHSRRQDLSYLAYVTEIIPLVWNLSQQAPWWIVWVGELSWKLLVWCYIPCLWEILLSNQILKVPLSSSCRRSQTNHLTTLTVAGRGICVSVTDKSWHNVTSICILSMIKYTNRINVQIYCHW